jgi:hypothetical protein
VLLGLGDATGRHRATSTRQNRWSATIRVADAIMAG